MFAKSMVAVAALLVGSTALAHGGAEHVMGAVKSVTADALVVSTAHGTRSFRVTDRTSVVKDGSASALTEVHPGDRVVVHATHGAPQEAERIVARSGKAHSHPP